MLYLSRKNLFLRKKKNRTSAESISVSVSLITLRSVKSAGFAKQLRMLRPIDISLLLSTESLNLLNVDSSFSYFSSLIFNSVINFSFWSSKVWRLWRRFSFSAAVYELRLVAVVYCFIFSQLFILSVYDLLCITTQL